MKIKFYQAVAVTCSVPVLACIYICSTELLTTKSVPASTDRSENINPSEPNLSSLNQNKFDPLVDTLKVVAATPETTDRPPFVNTKLKSSKRLGQVVDKIIKYTSDKKLPIDDLSITLIDLNTNEIAHFNGDIPRYPASVVKLFWLVAIYDKIATQNISESEVKSDINNMILRSDNQGASHILDAITNTHSQDKTLEKSEFSDWKERRQKINTFFIQQGYGSLNVSQKTFPIPQENIMSPAGPDQQLRGGDVTKPFRNKFSTDQSARLMYDIINKQILPNYQPDIIKLLTRNIDPTYWKKQPPNPIEFNPVESFLGEGLSPSRWDNIISKAGWTTASRQEVAYIQSKDRKHRYILAVFGDHTAYGNSKKIFPNIASLLAQEISIPTNGF
jgi:hypothetical protein